MEPESNNPTQKTAPAGRTLSGRWMVAGMFAFATAATCTLFVYWKLHVGPFLPLQQAIAAEFKGSAPRVEGGQRKMHKNTPRILRVTMKVRFDPLADEPHARAFADRVDAFIRDHHDVSPYDVVELHFYWPDPEKTIHEWSTERKSR